MDLLVDGMYGLGDNLHQRAVVRGLQRRGARVFLRTPWPQLFHDLRGPALRLLPPSAAIKLRTQAKNAAASAALYDDAAVPAGAGRLRVWYSAKDVARSGSIIGAMLASCGLDQAATDFRLPVPRAWVEAAEALVGRPRRPIMLYRPLVERTEWAGCANRNPDAAAYAALYAVVRENFHVVSVADLAPGVEWISGRPAPADLELHRGELSVEALVGLASIAGLVFASPGFAAVLAPAVGAPSVCVFGGRECSAVYAPGAALAPTLGIDTIRPCACFNHLHGCEKRIDVPAAAAALRNFVAAKIAA